MLCPSCRGKTKVIDSRETTTGVCRRRKCLECGVKFTTKELLWFDMNDAERAKENAKKRVELLQESINSMKNLLG